MIALISASVGMSTPTLFAALAALGLPVLPALIVPFHAAHDVRRHKAALLCVGQHRAQADQDAFCHRGRTLACPQIILELADNGHGEMGEPEVAQKWNDVQTQVLAIGFDRSALQLVTLASLYPQLPGVGDGRAFARRDVDTLANVDLHERLARVGVLLAGKRLDVAGALDTVVNDPRFLRLAFARDPRSLAN
jgi:hypothetical protein